MKTAISVPDDIFADAEKLARVQKRSRSDLYSRAVREYVARHASDQITESLNMLCEEELASNDFAIAAARQIFEHTEW